MAKPGSTAPKVQPALAQAMQQALALYSNRDWDKAEQVCRMVLGAQGVEAAQHQLAAVLHHDASRDSEISHVEHSA